jgi:hypothetical protein
VRLRHPRESQDSAAEGVPPPGLPATEGTRRDAARGLWIHYRLGKLADPVLAAIVDAVRHALTHTDRVHRDAERLKKRTGCCLPAPGDVTGVPCCSPPPAITVGQ